MSRLPLQRAVRNGCPLLLRTRLGGVYRVPSRDHIGFPPGRGARCVLVFDHAGHLTALPLWDVATVEPDEGPAPEPPDEAIPA